MSKLTDKLEALLLWGQNRGTERVPMAMTMVADILADVRELETRLDASRYMVAFNDQRARDVKREAYEHALELLDAAHERDLEQIETAIQTAINALDKEESAHQPKSAIAWQAGFNAGMAEGKLIAAIDTLEGKEK